MMCKRVDQMAPGPRGISSLKSQRGAVAIMTGLATLLLLIGFGALAIDVGHLYVVRNELQNAADAGALAGAQFLSGDGFFRQICRPPFTVDTDILQKVQIAATANESEGVDVEVEASDVTRGHWSFASRTFTPYSGGEVRSYDCPSTSSSTDLDTKFMNAVRVVVRRRSTPAVSFLAGIFGYAQFEMEAEAIAYFYCRSSNCPPLEIEDLAIVPNTVYLVE